jgi:hypothetical protein
MLIIIKRIKYFNINGNFIFWGVIVGEEYCLVIKWGDIDDPKLKETFRRLAQMWQGSEYWNGKKELRKIIEIERPELLGKQWQFPPWIGIYDKEACKT